MSNGETTTSFVQLDPRVTKELRFENNTECFITDYVPVDTAKKYFVSFKAKSGGTVPSVGYFGIDCYDKNKQRISIQDIHPIKEAPAVTVKSLSSDRKTLMIEGGTAEWKVGTKTCVALYINGVSTSLPLKNTETRIFKEKTSNSIELMEPLPNDIEIKPNVTQARLHYYGGAICMHPAMKHANIPPETWTTYEAYGITGEAYGENLKVFRPGTKYVRLGFLANFGQRDVGAVMLVKDFEFGIYQALVKI